jgi:hypothetical protein
MILIALALAQSAAAACSARDAGLPRDLSGWKRGGSTLDTGHAVMLKAAKGGAETRVVIRKAGVFGIAVDQQAWVDVFPTRAGHALDMASESKGPACSTIRKVVRYRLKPGTYRVAVTRLDTARVKLMLVHGRDAPTARKSRGRAR